MEEQPEFTKYVKPNFKTFLLAVWLVLLLAELNSSYLFLWPSPHSCAKAKDFNQYAYLLTDFKGATIDFDAIQTNLIDAAPDSPFTIARASSFGINYDDIGHCFEYPLDFSNETDKTPVVNREGLEECRNGLLFAEMGHNLSIISHFKLACSRQWLKVLLYQSIGLGLLLAIILSWWLLKQSDQDDSKELRENLMKILAASVVLYHCCKRLESSFSDESNDYYTYMLVCVFVRCIIISSNITRIIIKWEAAFNQSRRTREFSFWFQLKEEHNYFIIFSILTVIFQALYWPLALRVFKNWLHLNNWLATINCILASLTAFLETIKFNYENVNEERANNKTSSSSFNVSLSCLNVKQLFIKIAGQNFSGNVPSSATLSCSDQTIVVLAKKNTKVGRSDDDLVDNDDDNTDDNNDNNNMDSCYEGRELFISRLNNFTEPAAPTTRVCEFCLLNEQPIVSQAASWRMNHTYEDHADSNQMWLVEGELLQNNYSRGNNSNNTNSNNNNGSTNGGRQTDDSSLAGAQSLMLNCFNADSTYQPTTVPLGEPELSLKKQLISEVPAKKISSNEVNAVPKGRQLKPAAQVQHDFSDFYRTLMDRPVFARIWLLNFCVCFNYFLFQMLPDHRLIHSQPMSVGRVVSRQSTATEHIVLASGTNSLKYELILDQHQDQQHQATNQTTMGDGHVALNGTSHPTTNTRHEGINSSLKSHYRNLDYATSSIRLMSESLNPFKVVWKVGLLNYWPISLLVLLLHAKQLSTFESSYFKLKRLLALVKFSSQVLIVEWLAIGEWYIM